jgi:hypothetical protein
MQLLEALHQVVRRGASCGWSVKVVSKIVATVWAPKRM